MKNVKILTAILGLVFALSLSVSAQKVIFTSLDGEKIDIEAQKGKVVVMAIGAHWLPLSDVQANSINKLAKKYNGKDVVFYFISTDSTAEKSKNYASDDDIRKFASKNDLSVTILRDSDGAISLKKYSIDQMPSFIILDKQGKLATNPFGGIDPKNDISVKLSAEIDKLL